VKNSSLFITVLLVAVLIVFTLAWLNMPEFVSHTDLQIVLTTSTATFGTILGIITAGLMFTQGRFSELSSELSEKSPEYITKELSIERIQSTGTLLLFPQKAYTQLTKATIVSEERSLYERIITKTSSMLVDFAVLLNLKLRQQGLSDSSLLVSEMGSDLYKVYKRRRKNIKKEWHLFKMVKQIVDVWEAPTSFSIEKENEESALHSDLNNSISILKLKENIDKSSANMFVEIGQTTEDLDSKISRISDKLDKDRIPQLLSQIEQASILRGRYFYLTLIFIAIPFLINLLILPQLSAATALFFRQIILVTSLLSIIGVIFLLLYIHKMLNL